MANSFNLKHLVRSINHGNQYESINTSAKHWRTDMINKKILDLNIIIFLFLFSSFVHAKQSIQITKTEPVKFLCDFKEETPNFYDQKNGMLTKREDIGIEFLTKVFNKFFASKIVITKRGEYLFGYFISINDVTEKVSPNPIGEAYVKKNEMLCLNIENLF